MPTLPPGPDQDPVRESHRARAMAESFGVDADRYDRTRPPYPAALVERVLALAPGSDVLDAGIGTGISARPFRDAGGRVLGIEPDPRMAAFARRDGFAVEESTFEAWDPAGRRFDVVAAGQAWHWVDPAGGAEQAARVLRPGGVLAVFWNSGEPPAELARSLAEAHERVLPGTMASRVYRRPAGGPHPYGPLAAKTVAGLAATGAFAEPQQEEFGWDRAYTRDAWLDEVPTQGLFTRLPPDTLAALLGGIGDALDAHGGGFTMHYRTLLLTAVRR